MTLKSIDLLREKAVEFEEIQHSFTMTAQQAAHAAHLSGKKVSKCVIVAIDQQYAIVVLRASEHVNLLKLREITGAADVRLVSEEEIARRFPDCEPGAIPPFGNLYGLPVYVSPSLATEESFVFNPGSHRELIKIHYSDFDRIVHPAIVDIAAP